MYDVFNFLIRSVFIIVNKILNYIGLINISVGIIVSKNILKDILFKVIWFRVLVISDSCLIMIKVLIRGVIKFIKILLIKEYFIKLKFNNVFINCDMFFYFK